MRVLSGEIFTILLFLFLLFLFLFLFVFFNATHFCLLGTYMYLLSIDNFFMNNMLDVNIYNVMWCVCMSSNVVTDTMTDL